MCNSDTDAIGSYELIGNLNHFKEDSQVIFFYVKEKNCH